ncbi:MAG: hypothetical protein KBS60_07555, partial [Phascolarctobacterium sp.]|nr:hypothetical protein [Candidatus Phascolarctobacterium caballi]
CVAGVHLIILDDNISPQIHLINKDEFNPINRSMFNNEEKLYMATKMVEYGYHVHKFGTQYKECRTEDIIKRFLDTCGRFVDVPEGEENEVLSTENATTITTFNEAFSNFYNEIKQVPFSKKFDKNNFEDYFKDTNCKLSNHDNFKIPNLYGRDKKNLEIVKGYEGAKDKGRYVKGFVVEPLSKVKEAAIAYAEEIKNSVQEPEVLSDYNFVEELVRMLDNDEIYQKFFNEFGCLDINSPLPPNFKEVTGGNSQYSNADGEKIMFSKQFFNL